MALAAASKAAACKFRCLTASLSSLLRCTTLSSRPGFCSDIGNEEEGYFDALVRMFEQALKVANTLSANGRDGLVTRLNRVREISHRFGYGVGDGHGLLRAKYTRRSR
jgi:hypothetical protein